MKSTIQNTIIFALTFATFFLLASDTESDTAFYISKIAGFATGYAAWVLHKHWTKAEAKAQ